MNISIKSPEVFNIYNSLENKTYFGGNQEWYHKKWNKDSGCGPTSAANITAYLALTRERFRNLYPGKSMEQNEFAKHMEEMFHYITPGPMGVNSIDKYIDGFMNYVNEKEVELTPKNLSVDLCNYKKRDAKVLEEFVLEALSKDCPIAFLNLSKGAESKLQGWHWITITHARIEEDDIIAIASDEGIKREFSLKLWYLTTKMHGGLIYFN
ncbi:MAG: hypothetical protein K0S61_2751 [Anaerocolumna sp.]|jgi:hypothetical protein|nr:hypothetical protein [Anaerocolumna sp.]